MSNKNKNVTPLGIDVEKKTFVPSIRLSDDRLLTVRAFSIIRNEKSNFQYLITLDLPHDGEINPLKLTTDNSELITISFKKHVEKYRGSWVNFAVKWQENEDPLLVLFFTCTRVND